MADNDNSFLNANHIYVDVEGETGKTLKLEDEQRNNLVGLIHSRFSSAELSRNLI
jgi:hypothetical protein